MQLAPVVLFAYNRPNHTRRTLEALSENDFADKSTLYIYVDGPKFGSLPEDAERVKAVRSVIRGRQWCRDVRIVESDYNKGLADSIVHGVTEVVNRHGRVIVLEDDIVTRRGFLRYMNEALDLYATDDRVMHISGMIFGTPRETNPEGTSFLRILSCNGWGTWKRAWSHYCHDVDTLINRLEAQGISKTKFDIEGSGHFYAQLLANREGKIKTWAVRWYASWLTSGGFSLFPHRSLITNIGHDQEGTHTPAAFYNGETVDCLSIRRKPVKENRELRKEVDEIWRKGRGVTQRKYDNILRNRARRLFVGLLHIFRKYGRRLMTFLYPELRTLDRGRSEYAVKPSNITRSHIAPTAKVYAPRHIWDSSIGDYSYITRNSWVSLARIGKFCSIGPNFYCGWGIHPVDGISTSPMFYSVEKQNDITLCNHTKVQERKPIEIGNDVFIGMNVTILDGVTVGDGAVIGAGTVVAKDVPAYAIVAGSPMQLLRYRFSEEIIDKMLEIQWWNWSFDELLKVEKLFFDVDKFVTKYYEDN